MFECPLARHGWQVVKCAFDINLTHGDNRSIIMVGCGAFFCGACRGQENEVVFKDKMPHDPTELMYNIYAWLDKMANTAERESKREGGRAGKQRVKKIRWI